MTVASACGKVILFGEHAVVYGRPALAVPLREMRARVRVESRDDAGTLIHAQNLGRTIRLAEAAMDDPIAAITRWTLAALGSAADLEIWIDSDLPIASGLGSGAAVSTAIVRAVAAHLHHPLTPQQVSELVFESEKLHHGTPSGIDNTVIAYEMPVRFSRNKGIVQFQIARPFTLAIADTGITSPTRVAVGDVRRGWEAERARFEDTFDAIASVVERAYAAIIQGRTERLGELMNENQEYLRRLGVSSPAIERLLAAGLAAGARGGKLSGGGRGGNVIFHVDEDQTDRLHKSLLAAGATRVITTRVG